MTIINNKLNHSENSVALSRSDARKLLRYTSAMSASYANDETWINSLKLNLLSPSKNNFPISSQTLKAHEKCFFDQNSGLKISIIGGDKEIIIAFGSVGSCNSEVAPDEADSVSKTQLDTAKYNLLGFSYDIYDQAAKFVEEFSRLEAFRNKKIVLVGQSLGGSLAQFAGLKNQLSTYCFNPIALGRAQIHKLSACQLANDKNIFVVSVEGDYATDIVEHAANRCIQYLIQTPKLFGKKYTIPSAYTGLFETHSYFMGSLMKYLGYDIRTKAHAIPQHELYVGKNEERLMHAIQEIEFLLEKLAELKNFLNRNEHEKASELLESIKNSDDCIFNYFSFMVWMANDGGDFGDFGYGEHRLLDTPFILEKINANNTPILDALIEHFKTILFVQNAKISFVKLSKKTGQITQAFSQLPFVSEMKEKLQNQLPSTVQIFKNAGTDSKDRAIFDADIIKILMSLDDELQNRNGTIQRRTQIIDEISKKYPKVYFSLLLLLKKQINNPQIDFSKLSALVNENPSILIKFFNSRKNILVQFIECMKCLQEMQNAIDNLVKLKPIFQSYLKFLPAAERNAKENLPSVNFETLLEQIEELETFFFLANGQRRQLNEFHENRDHLPISSKEAIKPDRIIEAISQENAKGRIYMVCAECSGVIKVGGLAEAVRGIGDGLKSKGYEVTLIMPKYDTFPNDQEKRVMDSLELTPYEINHCFGDVRKVDRVFSAKINDLDVLFIEDTQDRFSLKGNELYKIPGDIGEEKMKERFAYFGQAVTELIRELKQQIDIVFVHDWHGALAIPLLARNYTKEWLEGSIPPLVYVFHNNGYSAQGMLDDRNHLSVLKSVRLPWQYFNTTKECLSIADHVCTVSESYALEVQGREGNGLQKEMRNVAQKGMFTGITNGCNLALWNPETEKQLTDWVNPLTQEKTPINFGIASDLLESKKLIKEQLQNWLLHYHPEIVDKYGLDMRKENVILFVGRYDASQKGIDKFRQAMRVAAEKGATFIVMGYKEDDIASDLLDKLESEAVRLKDPNQWGGAWIIRDSVNSLGKLNTQQGTEAGIPGIGHLVRAAANINFCPSEYEPCGLSHLEGFPYAQFAVATDLGGYADLICDRTEDPMFNGFLFPRIDDWKSDQQDQVIQEAMRSAIDYWNRLTPPQKNTVMLNLIEISKQLSWTSSPTGLSPIEKYEKVMLVAEKAIKSRGAREMLHPALLSASLENKNHELS
jgi:glycogen synthase